MPLKLDRKAKKMLSSISFRKHSRRKKNRGGKLTLFLTYGLACHSNYNGRIRRMDSTSMEYAFLFTMQCTLLDRFRFCPGVRIHKGITIVLSLFRSHWLAVVYCLVLCSGSCEPVHEDKTSFFFTNEF